MNDRPSPSHERLIVEAASRAGLGIVVAQLAPIRILHANTATLELFGVTEEELHRRDPFDLVAPEQRELLLDRLRRRLAGETLPPPEITLLRPDGTRVVIECRIVDLLVEGRPGAAVFLAARTLATADLAADARYRALVDAAPDGVVILRGSRPLYANRAALALVGVASFAELSQKEMADFLSSDDIRTMTERAALLMSGGPRLPPRDYRLRGLHRDTLVEVSSMVIDFEGGPAVLAFVRDVTEVRRAQAELERTQRLTALGTLVAGVAHEVNNPLSFASMAAEMLERFFSAGCGDVDSGRAALANVTAGLDRIASLVRELRKFVRSDEPSFVTVEMSEILSSALRMTAPLIRARASLEVELDALPLVQTSPGRLEQVFVNLLINAAQSFEHDDVATNVVRVRARASGRELTVTVTDNGRGISREHLPRVFDPFFTTKPAGEGTGLGLSICHAIIDQHGGRVEVSSTVGQGTTVTVILRSEADRAPQPNVIRPSRPSRSPRRRILVVDDEPAIGRLLNGMLASHHDVTVATGGAEAEALLSHGDALFDVVLCDLTMADVSGAVLFERVCARRPELQRRFVFMTGGLFTDEIIASIGGSSVPRLEKPFSPTDIAEVIERVAGQTN